ncbi:MAG TPA: hypothetical protein ENG03_09600 [Thioploca sp.]|nr:MAG: hypothetical protein DRR19_02070 [Gammaproteobacteria bacterium]HDN27331.1 hypothetical protein [Thioploca sp.]
MLLSGNEAYPLYYYPGMKRIRCAIIR